MSPDSSAKAKMSNLPVSEGSSLGTASMIAFGSVGTGLADRISDGLLRGGSGCSTHSTRQQNLPSTSEMISGLRFA